jgi:hypothetical protein
LELNLNEPKHLGFVKIMGVKKNKLPSLRRLRVDYFQNFEPLFNDFLYYCVPNHLELLSLNYDSNFTIEAYYYLSSLKEAFKKSSKENYIRKFDLSKKNWIQEIVKASAKWNRLIIRMCKIGSEEELDFSGPFYETTFISFEYCGDYVWDDWSSKTHRFENIVFGIKNSFLKYSLKSISVHKCGIGKSKAQEILNFHGLDSIIANEDQCIPMK